MNNFISENKKLLIIFFIFLNLAIASYIYINQSAVIKNPNYSQRQILDGQNQLNIRQVQQGSAVSEENLKISKSTSTSSETELSSERHIIYVGEKKYEISVPEKSTVYELMDLLKARGDFSFQGKDFSGLGFFVEEINGIKNNPSGKTYWIYYVNDKSAQVGISNYTLKPNDVINWKYEKPQF
ncbi:MAG: DUF4430 domain-containing protein [Candidatus Nealsonbacteria bacterium]|nr:DUF4430 domain-containing protein [Candidatus Nealsonbacteria bacterium]